VFSFGILSAAEKKKKGKKMNKREINVPRSPDGGGGATSDI